MTAFEVLKKRGFVEQCTNEREVRRLLSRQIVTHYIGFDPTADSLHLGSLVPIMAMKHLQEVGHRPIVVIGGGTAMIGDPSGKTEARRLMSSEEIEANGRKILHQLERYLTLDGIKGVFVNNADWLTNLKYIEFLRDIGRYFKVNEMVKVESYKVRLERAEGLSFIEFNYQLLQSYDFLVLFDRYGCNLQMGGNDQWGNIVAGMDLIQRVKGVRKGKAFGLTFPLLTTASGQKMGKTENGTVWLDSEKTSPYEFYQYWINTDDPDVIRFLRLFTFLPLREINDFKKLKGSDLRRAKEVLAYEATKLTHGDMEAKKVQDMSLAIFGGQQGKDFSQFPTTNVKRVRFQEGISLTDLLTESGLASSKSDARRLIIQGGIYVNNEQESSVDAVVHEDVLREDRLILRRGKKQYHQVVAV